MGVELIIPVLSAVIGAVGTVATISASNKAAKAQKEARNIQSAQQKNESAASRRQAIREDRIRRARILAASENTGTGASSGAMGAIGALDTNLSGLLGASLGESKANSAISGQLQIGADFEQQANNIGALTGMFQSGLSGFQSGFDTSSKRSVFD